MLHVTAALPEGAAIRYSAVLIHGAANSATVWTYWQRELAARGIASYAIDLRGHGRSDPADLSRASMSDYADDVRSIVDRLRDRPVLVGWSMGGLIAMMLASEGCASAVVGLAPSTPARERDTSIALRTGEFGIEEYGITNLDPDAPQPAMPDLDREERMIALASASKESRYARDERAAGVVVPAIAAPLLIVTSTSDTQWPRSRYDALHLPAQHLSVDGASHWGLVLNRRVLATLVDDVVAWLDRHLAG